MTDAEKDLDNEMQVAANELAEMLGDEVTIEIAGREYRGVLKIKIGDTVKVKPGVVGAGQTGVVEKIEPWNLDSPWPDLREDFYYLHLDDGVRAKFKVEQLELVRN